MLDTSLDPRPVLQHVARRLGDFGAPLGASLARIEGLADGVALHKRGADLTEQLAGPPQVVVSGWACQMRPEPRRRRQIFGFLLPGDVIGSFWRRPEYSFWRLSTLTRLFTVSAAPLLAVDGEGRFVLPELVQAARRAEEHHHHLLINHVVRLGARDAYAGLAHLLLELHHRLDRVGLAADGAFTLPIGQRVLAQAMGFSVAHTNHTLQRMVADGLFSVEGERVRLLQPDRLAELAEFSAMEPDETLLGVARPKDLRDDA